MNILKLLRKVQKEVGDTNKIVVGTCDSNSCFIYPCTASNGLCIRLGGYLICSEFSKDGIERIIKHFKGDNP